MPIYHWTVPFFFFFFNDTATTEIYTLSLHDALPISPVPPEGFYPGEYLKDTARKLFERDGEKWFDKPEPVWLRPDGAFAYSWGLAMSPADPASAGWGFSGFLS